MSSKALRTVLIGAGRIGAQYSDDTLTASYYRYASHAQVLSDHAAFSWDAVVDPSIDALRYVRQKWNIKHSFSSVEELLEVYEPEVAIIATPPDSRYEILEALPSLRAIIVEKPLGNSISESRRFLNLCKEKGIAVQVNLWRRADEQFCKFSRGELQARIGAVQAMFGLYGNGLRNNGTHLIDFIRMLQGEVRTVQAITEPTKLEGTGVKGDTQIGFVLHLQDGSVAYISPIDFAHYREVGLDLWGEKGRLTILQEGLSIRHSSRKENRALTDAFEIASDEFIQIKPTVGTALFNIYTNLAEHLKGKESLVSPGESAFINEQIIEAIIHSAENGFRKVDLKVENC
jgi:predicted dehydrogenase